MSLYGSISKKKRLAVINKLKDLNHSLSNKVKELEKVNKKLGEEVNKLKAEILRLNKSKAEKTNDKGVKKNGEK